MHYRVDRNSFLSLCETSRFNLLCYIRELYSTGRTENQNSPIFNIEYQQKFFGHNIHISKAIKKEGSSAEPRNRVTALVTFRYIEPVKNRQAITCVRDCMPEEHQGQQVSLSLSFARARENEVERPARRARM